MDFGYDEQQVQIYYRARKDRLTAVERGIVEGCLSRPRKLLREIGKPYRMQPMKVKHVYNKAVSKLLEGRSL